MGKVHNIPPWQPTYVPMHYIGIVPLCWTHDIDSELHVGRGRDGLTILRSQMASVRAGQSLDVVQVDYEVLNSFTSTIESSTK